MNHFHGHARSRAPVSSHSLGRILVVALLATLLPVLVVAALVAPAPSAAFLGGAATAGAIDALRHRTRRVRGRRESAPAVRSAR